MNNVSALRAHQTDHDSSFPILPAGMERDGFIRLFQNVASTMFNLNDAEIATFVCMAEDPRPSDWKSPDKQPVCYRRQGEVANRRGLHRVTVNRHERRLAAVGLIEKRTMADGRRSGFVGCGIFFSKAIELVPSMLDHKNQQEVLAQEHNLLCNTRSIHKGHLRAVLTDLTDVGIDATDIVTALELWPDARDLRRMSVSELREHVEEADQITQNAIMLLDESINSQHRSNTHATPLIQDTTQDLKSVCNTNEHKRCADKPAHFEYYGSEPNGPERCKEKKSSGSVDNDNREIRLKIPTAALYAICSDDMRYYVTARTNGGTPTDHDISWAAIRMLQELGINQAAFTDACEAMGYSDALLALIITDANRSIPEIRVRNPGGYLRALTAAAKAGRLNLYASLRALQRRRASELPTS